MNLVSQSFRRTHPLVVLSYVMVIFSSLFVEGYCQYSTPTTGSSFTALTQLDQQQTSIKSRLSPEILSFLLVGGAMTRISWNLEDPQQIRRFLDQSAFGITDVGDVYGDGLFLGAGLLGVTAAARLSGNQRLNEFSSDLSRSLLISSTATWVLKLSVGRKRPNGGPHSFPSGHTSAAFCVAPVIARHFGWKAAVPAYVLAGFTGIARMEDRKHYLSDVFFGAAIGLAAGDAVSGGGIGTHLLDYIDIGLDSVGLSLRF